MTKKSTDEAHIQAMIASDPDAPEATDAQLAAEGHHEVTVAFDGAQVRLGVVA